jgi:hypothetical protein
MVRRYVNARNTFAELLAYGTIPIVNENDTVAVQELRFGDNDTLSAQVRVAVCDCDGNVVLSLLLYMVTTCEWHWFRCWQLVYVGAHGCVRHRVATLWCSSHAGGGPGAG